MNDSTLPETAESVTILQPCPLEKPVPVRRKKPQASSRGSKSSAKLTQDMIATAEKNYVVLRDRIGECTDRLGALQATLSDRLIGVTAILRNLAERQAYFSDQQAKIAEQLNAMDNDVQTILEKVNPIAGSQQALPAVGTTPVSLGDLLGSIQEQPKAYAASKPATPLANNPKDLGLRTVNTPAPRPMPKIPIPKPPEATQKMEYVGDISAMADALVFDDNKLTQ